MRLLPGQPASRLDRSRLARPGNRPADAAQWTARAGAVLIAGAAAVLAYTALRPLPEPEAVEPESLPVIPTIAPHGTDMDARRERLARLGAGNVFDAEREPWAGQRREMAANPDGEQPANPAAAATPATQQASIGGQSLAVTRAEALPEDIKLALTGLALRGFYVPPGARAPVALISRVHAGTNPLASDSFRVGDEFEDKQHPQAKWRVIAIDQPGRQVILQRGGVNASLSLYGASTPAGAAAEPQAKTEPAKPAVPSVSIQTDEEIKAALREFKFTEEEIERLLKLAEMSPEEAAAAARMEALARSKPADGQTPGRRPPPAGLEAFTKLLQQPPPDMGTEEKPAGDQPATPRKRRNPN